MTIGVAVRPAHYEDLPAVSDVHIKSWRQAYAGLIDQEHLDSLDANLRLQKWQEVFLANKFNNGTHYGLLVADVAHHIAGFVAFGPARDADFDGCMEMTSLYTLEEYWSTGVGFKLFIEANNTAHAYGYTKTYLWVLEGNERALRAYRRWGGQVQTERVKEQVIGKQTVREICVVFHTS